MPREHVRHHFPFRSTTPKPTETPKPTPTPEPTRHPGDPLPPPRVMPTPAIVLENQSAGLSNTPHPDGLAGCRSLHRWVDPFAYLEYAQWCELELTDAVTEHCAGEETPSEKQICADNWLADVKEYTLRELTAPCLSASDQSVCWEDKIEGLWEHLDNYRAGWNAILLAVTDDADVKVRFNGMNDCISAAGYRPLDANAPPPWQQIDPDKVSIKPNRTASEREAFAAHLARTEAVDQCAVEVEFYEALDAQWLQEIQELFVSAPEQVQALKAEGIIGLLEEPGAAPFLIIGGPAGGSSE